MTCLLQIDKLYNQHRVTWKKDTLRVNRVIWKFWTWIDISLVYIWFTLLYDWTLVSIFIFHPEKSKKRFALKFNFWATSVLIFLNEFSKFPYENDDMLGEEVGVRREVLKCKAKIVYSWLTRLYDLNLHSTFDFRFPSSTWKLNQLTWIRQQKINFTLWKPNLCVSVFIMRLHKALDDDTL